MATENLNSCTEKALSFEDWKFNRVKNTYLCGKCYKLHENKELDYTKCPFVICDDPHCKENEGF